MNLSGPKLEKMQLITLSDEELANKLQNAHRPPGERNESIIQELGYVVPQSEIQWRLILESAAFATNVALIETFTIRFLDVRPNNTSAIIYLALMMSKRATSRSQAVRTLEKITVNERLDLADLTNLARAYSQAGLVEIGAGIILKALDNDYQNFALRKFLLDLYEHAGLRKKAIVELGKLRDAAGVDLDRLLIVATSAIWVKESRLAKEVIGSICSLIRPDDCEAQLQALGLSDRMGDQSLVAAVCSSILANQNVPQAILRRAVQLITNRGYLEAELALVRRGLSDEHPDEFFRNRLEWFDSNGVSRWHESRATRGVSKRGQTLSAVVFDWMRRRKS